MLSNKECEQKFGDAKPVCAIVCVSKYGHNGPKGGVCNALEEPSNIWNRRDLKVLNVVKIYFVNFQMENVNGKHDKKKWSEL